MIRYYGQNTRRAADRPGRIRSARGSYNREKKKCEDGRGQRVVRRNGVCESFFKKKKRSCVSLVTAAGESEYLSPTNDRRRLPDCINFIVHASSRYDKRHPPPNSARRSLLPRPRQCQTDRVRTRRPRVVVRRVSGIIIFFHLSSGSPAFRASHTPHTPVGLQSHVYRWPGIASVRRHTDTCYTNNNDGKHVRSEKHAFAVSSVQRTARSIAVRDSRTSEYDTGVYWVHWGKKNVGSRGSVGSVAGPQVQWASDESSLNFSVHTTMPTQSHRHVLPVAYYNCTTDRWNSNR